MALRARDRGPLIKAKPPVAEPARLTSFAEQTTLFIVALKKREADELLAGFAPTHASLVERCASDVGKLDSATRQARLAHEFGPSSAFTAALHALLTGSPPVLRAAIHAHLPPHLRPAGAPAASFSPALSALAARLVREARFA